MNMNQMPMDDQKPERRESWTGKIESYTPEDRDHFFKFGEKMWGQLGREWDPATKQKDLLDIHTRYQHDGGDFFLVKDQDEVVACTGLKPLEDKIDTLELARYYVLSEMRGQGIGKELLHHSIHKAIEAGKRYLVLDSHSEKSKDAVKIFEAVGFKKIEPYKPIETHHELISDIFMKLDLENYECPFCEENEKGEEGEENS